MTDENLTNKAYEAIELAAKTGKIKKGTNEVTKTIERGTAKLVLAAADVNPAEVILHLEPLCNEKGTPFVKVPSREELGAAAGLGIPTSSVAVVEPGESTGIINELAKAMAPKVEPKPEPKEEIKEAPKAKPKEEAPKEEKKAEPEPKEEAPKVETKEEKKEEPKEEAPTETPKEEKPVEKKE
ncbi:50S ribosomal protein L7ae [Candidatus Woesearchaeota archaeon]|jgi:large subunit ribosomal protein L7Ae|nr:50S ribosomal protein L7ae [Candidatus Woesearchaeota archaeon]MBT6045065.1 50S ribosomal protein L7ae [Candidatus Woesearchaeota archaeon]